MLTSSIVCKHWAVMCVDQYLRFKVRQWFYTLSTPVSDTAGLGGRVCWSTHLPVRKVKTIAGFCIMFVCSLFDSLGETETWMSVNNLIDLQSSDDSWVIHTRCNFIREALCVWTRLILHFMSSQVMNQCLNWGLICMVLTVSEMYALVKCFWLRMNWFYAQLHYFLNFSQLIVSCLPLLDKLIDPGVSDLSSHNNNNQAHLKQSSLSDNGRQETSSCA